MHFQDTLGQRWNLITMDPVVMQTVITRGLGNFCAIPENCDAGFPVHSGQVQAGEAKILNDELEDQVRSG